MRILVCGGRDYTDKEAVFRALDAVHAKLGITCIIHGDARGADRIGKEWALSRRINHEPYPADWNNNGKRAGPIRNQQMLDEGNPDGVVEFPGGTGTADMCRRAEAAGLKVWKPYG